MCVYAYMYIKAYTHLYKNEHKIMQIPCKR